MSSYIEFNTTTRKATLGYDLFSSSNIILGATSNLYDSRLYIRGGGLVVEEPDSRNKSVFLRFLSSNEHDVMIGVYNTSNNSNAFVGTTRSTALVFGTRGAESMRIMANGNIGIGTTVARTGLEIGVGATFGGATGLTVNGSNMTSPGAFQVTNRFGTTSLRCLSDGPVQIFPGGGSNGLIVGSGVTVGRDIFVGGNIGIGTTFANQKLHIEGNIFMTGAVLQNIANRAIFSHRNTSVGGGSLQAGQYVTRIVNTVEYNDIAGVALSSGATGNTTFQIPSGIYHLNVMALAYNCGYTRLGLYNETNGTWVYGLSQFASTGTQVTANLDTIITPTGITVYSIRHYAEITALNNGMGLFNTATPGYATYMTVHINKIK